MCPRNFERFDLDEHIELLDSAGDRICHDFTGQVCNVDTMPRL